MAAPEPLTYDDAYLRGILDRVKTIAMVGASMNEMRPSYFAMLYLQGKGFRVIPVAIRIMYLCLAQFRSCLCPLSAKSGHPLNARLYGVSLPCLRSQRNHCSIFVLFATRRRARETRVCVTPP